MPFEIGIAVLGDDGGDALGMLDRQAEADRRAIVEDVDREFIEAEHFGETADHIRDILEGVRELIPPRLLGHAEARKIGRHDMVTARELWDQLSEHMARDREAVKEEDDGSSGIARLTVKELEAVYIGGFEMDGHGRSPWLRA